MSMSDVVVPADLWEVDAQAVVVTWLYQDGAVVKQGQVIAEVMIEKVQFDVLAPSDGVLHHKIPANGTFDRGEAFATVNAE